jgi:hypothetical protein
VVFDHTVSYARLAEATARSTSAALAWATVATVVSLAGLIEANCSCEDGSVKAPSMKSP